MVGGERKLTAGRSEKTFMTAGGRGNYIVSRWRENCITARGKEKTCITAGERENFHYRGGGDAY